MIAFLFLICVSATVAQLLDAQFRRADNRRVVYPGPLDQGLKPAPPKRTVKMVIGKLQERISDLVGTIRHPGDEDDVENHIDRLERQFETICELEFEDDDEKECEKKVKDKVKKGLKAAKREGGQVDDLFKRKKQRNKKIRKKRQSDAEPILEEFEKDLNKILGGGNVKKQIKEMDRTELHHAQEWIRTIKIIWKDKCAKQMKDGNSKYCSEVVEDRCAVFSDIVRTQQKKKGFGPPPDDE